MNDSSLSDGPVSAGPLRRLGAVFYDWIICTVIAAVTVFILTLVTFPLVPTAREHMLVASEIGMLAYVYRIAAASVVVLFIGYCWTRKGQTLGMQAWRIHIQTINGGLPSWRDCLLRMMLATIAWIIPIGVLALSEELTSTPLLWLGIGLLALPPVNYMAAWFDPQRRSWHDRFLKTRVRRVQTQR